jgi:diguanylate cyclase (GGDEF)-like protein
MVDVDHFKRYNDRYGHLPGDDALRQVAGALSRVVEGANAEGLPEAFVARYGGEEFSVILPRCPAKAFPRIAEALKAGVAALAIPHESMSPGGASPSRWGGVSPRAEGALAQLFRQADAKLYEAKRDGRNRVELAMA